MPYTLPLTTSEATIPTSSAAACVLQLAEHWAHKYEVRVTANGTLVPLSDMTIVTLRTAADDITVRIDTSDATGLTGVQTMVFNALALCMETPAARPVWTTWME